MGRSRDRVLRMQKQAICAIFSYGVYCNTHAHAVGDRLHVYIYILSQSAACKVGQEIGNYHCVTETDWKIELLIEQPLNETQGQAVKL